MRRIILMLFILGWAYSWMEGVAVQAESDPANGPHFDLHLETHGPEQEFLRVGEPFEWRIQVRWMGDLYTLNPQIQKQPKLDGLEIQNQATALRSGSEKGQVYSEKDFIYTFVPQTEGEALIGPAALSYLADATREELFLSTPSSAFTVHPAPFSILAFCQRVWNSTWFRIPLIFLVIIAILCVTLLAWMRSTKGKIETPSPEPPQDPIEGILEEARRFRVEGNRTQFVRKLHQAVQTAFQRQFPQISSEALLEFRDSLQPDQQVALDRFLENSEQIQFAPVSPSANELERLSDDARRLIATPSGKTE